MSRVEPDAGELLVRALDQVLGGVALARYAATQTEEPGLKRFFQRLATAGEREERLLRRQLAGYAGDGEAAGGDGSGLVQRLAQISAGLLALLTGVAGAALLIRWWRSQPDPSHLLREARLLAPGVPWRQFRARPMTGNQQPWERQQPRRAI